MWVCSLLYLLSYIFLPVFSDTDEQIFISAEKPNNAHANESSASGNDMLWLFWLLFVFLCCIYFSEHCSVCCSCKLHYRMVFAEFSLLRRSVWTWCECTFTKKCYFWIYRSLICIILFSSKSLNQQMPILWVTLCSGKEAMDSTFTTSMSLHCVNLVILQLRYMSSSLSHT